MSADIDRYLLASKKSESIIYRIGEVFEEVKRSEFNRLGGTIAAGCLLDGTIWAQIVAGEIRLYDHGRSLALVNLLTSVEIRVHQMISITDEEFGAHSRVRSASVADPWILLVLESGKVVVYEINSRTKDVDVHSKISLIQVRQLKAMGVNII
jgi:cleavage and polyadenylation specificity factor subunit 1